MGIETGITNRINYSGTHDFSGANVIGLDGRALESAIASFPASGNVAGDLRKASDGNRDLYMWTGSAWVSRNGAICNVRDFGALGDGTTNDTAAFTNALFALSLVGGGKLFIPAGTYVIARGNGGTPTDNIVSSNILIEGVGELSVLKGLNGAGSLPNDAGNETYTMFSATSQSNITIQNVKHTGYGTLLSAYSCTDISVRKCYINGLQANAGGYLYDKSIFTYKCDGVSIEGNKFYNSNFAVYLSGDGTTKTRNVAILGNRFENNVAAGSFTATFPCGIYSYYNDDCLVSGNIFRNIYSHVDNGSTGTGMGYGFYEGDGQAQRINVSNNSFQYDGNGSKNAIAIYLSQALNAVINGNTIVNGASGRLVSGIRSDQKQTANRTITGNSYKSSQTGFSHFAINVVGDLTHAGAVQVSNNVIDGSTNGVRVDSSGLIDVLISANQSINQLADGMLCSGDSSRPNQRIKFVGNTIKFSQNHGIYLNSYCIQTYIAFNTIMDGNLANQAGDAGSAIHFASYSFGSTTIGNLIGNSVQGGGLFTLGITNASGNTGRIYKDIAQGNNFIGFNANNKAYQYWPASIPFGIYDVEKGDYIENWQPASGQPSGWRITNCFRPTLAADASSASTTLTLASTSSISAGDILLLTKTDDMSADYFTSANWHLTTVASITDGTHLVITDAIPAGDGTYVAGTAKIKIATAKALNLA